MAAIFATNTFLLFRSFTEIRGKADMLSKYIKKAKVAPESISVPMVNGESHPQVGASLNPRISDAKDMDRILAPMKSILVPGS